MFSCLRRCASSCQFSILPVGLLSLLLTLSIVPISPLPAHTSLTTLWRSIFDSNPPDPPDNGGSRGDLFCPIAPNALPDTAIVWSDHPTLTWVSAPALVKRVDILKNGIVIWSSPISEVHQVQSVSADPTIATYQIIVGRSLELGQQYRWRTIRSDDVVLRSTRFQVMTAEERDRIAQALTQLNQPLVGDRIPRDTATLRQADFFASEQLWSEFWNKVLSVQNPSPELTTVIAETVATLCPVLSQVERLP